MEEALFVWLAAFFLIIALLVIIIFQLYRVVCILHNFAPHMLMCLADLEFDYINPYDSASRINSVVLPEFALQGLLCLLFLLSGRWGMFLFGTPVLYYNVRMYQQRHHLVDVTEIFNHLNKEKKPRLIKLVFHVILLFLALFWMIWSVLEDNE